MTHDAIYTEFTSVPANQDRIFGISRDHINKVLDYYQFHTERMNICIEECSELIKALTKNLRSHQWPERVRVTKDESRQMIVEEMTDVLVCCGMLQQMYGISQDEIDTVIRKKEERDIMIPRFISDKDGNLTPNPEWINRYAEKMSDPLNDFSEKDLRFAIGENDENRN